EQHAARPRVLERPLERAMRGFDRSHPGAAEYRDTGERVVAQRPPHAQLADAMRRRERGAVLGGMERERVAVGEPIPVRVVLAVRMSTEVRPEQTHAEAVSPAV